MMDFVQMWGGIDEPRVEHHSIVEHIGEQYYPQASLGQQMWKAWPATLHTVALDTPGNTVGVFAVGFVNLLTENFTLQSVENGAYSNYQVSCYQHYPNTSVSNTYTASELPRKVGCRR